MIVPVVADVAPTLGEAVAAAAAALAQVGVPDAQTDARLLAQHAFGLDRVGLLAARDLRADPDGMVDYAMLVARRAGREPVSRIVGRREFWSLDFELSPATLDPRPDSETLVEAALGLLPDRDAPADVLDLGTGTGCLLLAVLSERPAARGVGVDLSIEAVRTAQRNARHLGLSERAAFVAGDWTEALAPARFDLVVANPPYVAEPDVAALAPEVARFDPRAALAGGADGLDAYRRLAAALPGVLRPDGHAVVEVGAGQVGAAAALLTAGGGTTAGERKDLAGTVRCVIVRYQGGKKKLDSF